MHVLLRECIFIFDHNVAHVSMCLCSMYEQLVEYQIKAGDNWTIRPGVVHAPGTYDCIIIHHLHVFNPCIIVLNAVSYQFILNYQAPG